MKRLGSFLREKRVERDLTLGQLADEVGVSAMFISDIENGKRIPSSGKAITGLSRFFGIDMSEIKKMAEMTRTAIALALDNEKSVQDAKISLARTIALNDLSEEKLKKIEDILNEKTIDSEANG
jgi:transcriptional regulator with XRE-family HTH domain